MDLLCFINALITIAIIILISEVFSTRTHNRPIKGMSFIEFILVIVVIAFCALSYIRQENMMRDIRDTNNKVSSLYERFEWLEVERIQEVE